MNELGTQSLGLLSHTTIPPGKLAELLDRVKVKLIEHLKEYELAMWEIHQYYDLPLVSYSYTDDMLILQIPFCVNITNNRHWNCLDYKQFQWHIIQTASPQIKTIPILC